MTGNSNNWQQFYEYLPGHEFCSNVSSDKVSKLRDLVEDGDTMCVDTMNKKIIIMHSPTNF